MSCTATDIRVGTASWTDPTLLACRRFYPPEARTAEQRLRFYASCFPIVEVDASYYALPAPAVAHMWAVRTPEDFVFNVKAHRLFTGHATPAAAFPADIRRELPTQASSWFYRDVPVDLRTEMWRRFSLALEPLRQAGKLGAVHFQFAPWVRHARASVAHLEACAEQMQDHIMATEFRHHSWFAGEQAARTLALQRALRMVHVVVDGPQGLPDTVPDVWAVTRDDLAIVRLHGRNREAWSHRGQASSGRFVYEYTEEELAHLAERIQRLAQAVNKTHVLFNTNHADQGVRNAGRMQHALATLPA